MQKKISIFTVLSSSLVLAACGSKDLSREEVVEQIEKQRSEVENYETAAVFDVGIAANGMEDHSEATMDLVVLEDKNQMKVVLSETDNMGNKTEEFHYVGEDTIYSSMDEQNWSEMPKAENYEVRDSVSISYDQLYRVFEEIEAELEFGAQDDYYLFSFDEKSGEIFSALEEPYNASVSGIAEDEMVHDLEIKVDKEDFFFMSFEDDMVGNVEDSQIELSIKHTFSDINAINELEIPDEVGN